MTSSTDLWTNSLALNPLPSWKPEVTIFGQEGGAREDILIGSDLKTWGQKLIWKLFTEVEKPSEKDDQFLISLQNFLKPVELPSYQPWEGMQV